MTKTVLQFKVVLEFEISVLSVMRSSVLDDSGEATEDFPSKLFEAQLQRA